MSGFALGMFDDGGGPFGGVVVGTSVHRLSDAVPGVADTAALLRDWDSLLLAVRAFADGVAPASGVDIATLRVLPPVHSTGTLYAAGANYRQHVIEMSVAHRLGRSDATADELQDEAAAEIDERAARGEPYVWIGARSAITGAYDDVQLPSRGADHDWELELGVIIGRRAHHVHRDDALSIVAGYTICNDISTRSLIPRTDIPMMGTDWMRAKNAPTFFPTGPFLVPAALVPDPQALDLRLTLNGEVMQNASTSDMLFDVARLIEYISSIVILEPGDMIITGSPHGNGSHYDRFLRDGDVMEASITGLGTQRSTVRGEQHRHEPLDPRG